MAQPKVDLPPASPVEELEKPKTALKIKASKDTTSRLLSALKKKNDRDDTKGISSYTRSSDRVQAAVKYVLKLGLKPFDEATGGLCFSKVVEIYGLDMSGKTALAMLACGVASQGEIYEVTSTGSHKKVSVPYDVTILYEDNENSLEEGDRLMVYGKEVDCITGECDTIDKIFKDIETCCDEIEAIQEETKRLQFLVVVVDTIAGTSTREEVQQEWSKQDYSRQPKQLRDGFRNIVRRLKTNNVCVICTNQVSDSFKPKQRTLGKSFLPQESDFSAFGGKALRYYAHQRIFVFKLPNAYKLAKGMFPDGFVVHFFTTKNRFKMPLRSGRLVLLFRNALGSAEDGTESAGGYSPLYSILEHLVYMKFISVGSAGNYIFNFGKYGISAPVVADLQKSDENDEDWTKVSLGSRLEWPTFYKKYEAQVELLFEKCVNAMFAQNGAEVEDEAEEFDLGELESQEE